MTFKALVKRLLPKPPEAPAPVPGLYPEQLTDLPIVDPVRPASISLGAASLPVHYLQSENLNHLVPKVNICLEKTDSFSDAIYAVVTMPLIDEMLEVLTGQHPDMIYEFSVGRNPEGEGWAVLVHQKSDLSLVRSYRLDSAASKEDYIKLMERIKMTDCYAVFLNKYATLTRPVYTV